MRIDEILIIAITSHSKRSTIIWSALHQSDNH